AEQGHQQGDLEGVPHHPKIQALAQRLGVPLERAALEAESQHAHDREEEEDQQQDQRRHRRPGAATHGARTSRSASWSSADLEVRAPYDQKTWMASGSIATSTIAPAWGSRPRAGWRTSSSR